MTSRIIRVKGNGGSRVFEAHSPHSPIPVVFTANRISNSGGPGVIEGPVVAWVGDADSPPTKAVAIFPSDWAVVEVASRVEGEEDPLSSEFKFGVQPLDSDFDAHGNYDVAPGD